MDARRVHDSSLRATRRFVHDGYVVISVEEVGNATNWLVSNQRLSVLWPLLGTALFPVQKESACKGHDEAQFIRELRGHLPSHRRRRQNPRHVSAQALASAEWKLPQTPVSARLYGRSSPPSLCSISAPAIWPKERGVLRQFGPRKGTDEREAIMVAPFDLCLHGVVMVLTCGTITR